VHIGVIHTAFFRFKPEYLNLLEIKLGIVEYFGGGVTMEYLDKLSVPEIININEIAHKRAEKTRKELQRGRK
jgi:hypothetical protein